MQQQIEKKSYETPAVVELGSVDLLTQGVAKGGSGCIEKIPLAN